MKTSTYNPRKAGARCDLCPLAGEIVVPPTPARARVKLAIVGEGPGYMEVNRLQPFVGPSGKMVDRLLAENQLARKHVHVTNAALCRYKSDLQLPIAVACCAPRLGRELGALPPEVPILGLGKTSVRPLLGKGAILRVRGFVWKAPEITDGHVLTASRTLAKKQLKGNPDRIKAAQLALCIAQGRRALSGRTVFATVHPAFITRGADQWTPVLRLDFGRAVEWAKNGPYALEDEEPFIETSSAKKAARLLAEMGPHVSLDIETNGRNPLLADITCIGVSDSTAPGVGRDVVLSPWHKKLVPVLNAAIAKRTVIGHNLIAFDDIACTRHGVFIEAREDTLIAHHAYAGHLPRSLAHVGSVYCKIGPWKAKFKEGEKGLASMSIASEELSKYNAADVRIDLRAWVRMQPDLKPELHVYKNDMRIARMCAEMQTAGIAIDDARRLEVAKMLRRKARRLLAAMRELLRRKGFDPAKPVHIRKALYTQLRIPINKDMLTKTGLPSTSKALLEAYADFNTRAGRFCQMIMDWRGANDTVSEYLDGEKFRETIIAGRVHSEWRSYGTEVGRPATHAPNILNMPRVVLDERVAMRLKNAKTKEAKDTILTRLGRRAYDPSTRVREIYVAGPGKVFVYFDLSQSQMRQAAHLSGDPNFVETCKGDVHTGNARLLFPEVDAAMQKDPSWIKGEGKVFRDIMKNVGFAILFLAEEDKVFLTLHAAGFTHVTMDQVRSMLAMIRTKYRVYAAYVQQNYLRCCRDGYLRSPYMGRIRRMGHYPKPTTVANFPIIAGEADIMMMRLIEIEDARPRSSPIVMWAYDAAIYECPEGEVGTDA